jgi:hypothetical protein
MAGIKNLVHQTTSSTGTGNLTLAAVNGKQTFSGAYGFGSPTDIFYYFAFNRNAAEWEYGTGHMSDATTLVRDTIIGSSNSNSPVNFTTGTIDVTNDLPAEMQDVHAATSKTTPADNDEIGLIDSAASYILKKLTWANLKATLKTYFDTLYQPLAAALTSWASVTRASGFDTWVATPSSANLRSLITDETGTGALYFAGGNAGTPSGITLTNGTGLPVAGIVGDTTTALGLGSINLGHTSDTTLSRSAAGKLAVEGVDVPTVSSSDTFTNKRITPRVGTTASSSTPTPDADSHDEYNVTALATGATFGAPTGTPTEGQKLIIRIKDNGTPRSLGFNAIYRGGADVALPTTTVTGKTMYLGLIYNGADSKWDLVAKVDNI